MSPSEEVRAEEVHALIGAVQALRFALSRVERQAMTVMFNSSPSKRASVIECIMQATKAYSEALSKCKSGDRPEGPNCKPGFHEEFGICVPDEPPPGG